MDDDDPRVSITPAQAADLCGRVYGCREDALAVAHDLRAAGWMVPVHDVRVGPRRDGSYVVAVVYSPETFELFGEVRYRLIHE